MIGTITHILAKAGYKAMNGPLADERRRIAGAVSPAAYVSYDPRLLAGAGWYGYRIALKGGDRSMVERARYMLKQQYVIRDSYEYYADGIYTFGVLLRQRVKMYGIGGGAEPEPSPDDFWGLKLKMPEGGTVILRKNGSPNAVSLEVSTDGTNWQPWELVGTDYSYTLQAGETLCIRNTSETFAGPSASSTAYWNFVFDSATYASGSIMSMATQDSTIIDMSGGTACFARLFEGCTSLLTAPALPALSLSENCYRGLFRNTSIKEAPELPATTLATECYTAMFRECTLLERAPILPAAVLAQRSYSSIFYGCSSLNYIYTMMTDITATQCIANWTNGVSATGDFYCPASLTILSGSSGIPNGWTRHDI